MNHTDDDTLDGASTFASMPLAIADDGTCPRHPHIQLREVGPDGFVYQKESCPECDNDFKRQRQTLKDRKRELDRQLKQLAASDDIDIPMNDDETAVSKEDIDALRDNLMQHMSGHEKRSMTDEEVSHPVGRRGQSVSQNGRRGMSDDQGYSRPYLSLESLANQMNMMQQMQDWMLREKETEMNILRNKVEEQQKELLKKEVEIALLKERLLQQEERMQQELKLIRLSVARKEKGKSKEIHIQELHVQVGANLADSAGDFDPKVVQAATKAATTAALENATAAALSSEDGPSAFSTKSPKTNKMVVSAKPPPPSSAPPLTSEKVPSSTKDEMKKGPTMVVAAVGTSAAVAAASSGSNQQKEFTVTPISEQEMASSGSNQQKEFTVSRISEQEMASSGSNQQKEFTVTRISEEKTEEEPEDDEEEDEDEEEGGDTFDMWGAAVPATAARLSPLGRKPTPVPGFKQGPLTTPGEPINPNPNRKEPLRSSIKSLAQPGLDDRPTGLPTKSEIGSGEVRGNVPREFAVDPDAPPAVSLQEEVTMGTIDQQYFQARFGAMGRDDRIDDNISIGNTVASSTYGEDRQKVVSQVLLDPYGDRGRFTGVVLRSTGMPHGLGRMVYEDDGRTYEGDWRHGAYESV
jgi:hypothetical protein